MVAMRMCADAATLRACLESRQFLKHNQSPQLGPWERYSATTSRQFEPGNGAGSTKYHEAEEGVPRLAKVGRK